MNKKNAFIAVAQLHENTELETVNNGINVLLVGDIFLVENTLIQLKFGMNIQQENKRTNNCQKSIIVLLKPFREKLILM